MEINEEVKIEHGLRTTTLAKFFFSCTIEKSLMDILFWKIKNTKQQQLNTISLRNKRSFRM